MNENTKAKIIELTNELRLSGIKQNFEEIITESLTNNINIEDFLQKILEKEFEIRLENRKKNKIRFANFPYKKYIEDINIPCLPKNSQDKLEILKSLDFIKNGNNLILAGNPGT